MTTSGIDDTILEMQKKIYREELIKDLRLKQGSQFYPFCIEPMPTERDRLVKPMTDADRAARKQWLADQKLSPREPINVPEWNKVNIFRRGYRCFFDSICGIFKPVLGPKYTKSLRSALPKIVLPYVFLCAIWYQVKYSPRTWESGFKGFRLEPLRRPQTFPGQPDFPHSELLQTRFADEGFSERKVFLNENLVTSSR